jgi:hypothetical protein
LERVSYSAAVVVANSDQVVGVPRIVAEVVPEPETSRAAKMARTRRK